MPGRNVAGVPRAARLGITVSVKQALAAPASTRSGDEDDLALGPVGLAVLVGLGRGLQREDLVDGRPRFALFHEDGYGVQASAP